MPKPIPSFELDIPGCDGRAGLLLRVPFRRELVAELKGNVPPPHRYWDEGVGAWWIDGREVGLAREIVLRHFPTVAVLGGIGEEPIVIPGPDADLQ
jgi:hypothetical protein